MQLWRTFLVSPKTSLVDAARIIDGGGGQIAVVVDEGTRLLGTITDADLRRALLNGQDFRCPCSDFMSKRPISLPQGSTREKCITTMLDCHIGHLPLVDESGRVVDVVLLAELYLAASQPNSVVIMAGGLGTRLAELTHKTPKPMLEIGGRPLLATLIALLKDQGFRHFYISLNYKAEVITEYFGDGSRFGVDIEYLREKRRLGTAGSLYLLPKDIKHDVVVMNGDVLSKVDVRKMLAFHRRAEAAATMAVKTFDMTVPYGVVNIGDASTIESIEEKPKQSYFINAGIYAVSPSVLNILPPNQFLDTPSLFDLCRHARHRICAYPLREYWIDIGHMDTFQQANFEFSINFSE